MHRTTGVAALALALAAGCGDGGGGAPAPPAGSHPAPSSESPTPAPARGGPMFAGPPRDLDAIVRGGGGMIARMVEKDRRREERERRGPERLADPAREGQEIAARLTEGLTPSQRGPCMDLWQLRRRVAAEQGVRLDESERNDWLRNCERLPEAQRNCLSPTYHREHQDECRESMELLTRRFGRETGVDLEHPGRSRALHKLQQRP